MDLAQLLKALAHETRMQILLLLLQHRYCVRALARKLQLTEGAISQHLKVLREAGLVTGVRKGYFMHYVVERHVLRGLATELERLASIELEPGALERGECFTSKHASRSNCGTCLRRVDGFE